MYNYIIVSGVSDHRPERHFCSVRHCLQVFRDRRRKSEWSRTPTSATKTKIVFFSKDL